VVRGKPASYPSSPPSTQPPLSPHAFLLWRVESHAPPSLHAPSHTHNPTETTDTAPWARTRESPTNGVMPMPPGPMSVSSSRPQVRDDAAASLPPLPPPIIRPYLHTCSRSNLSRSIPFHSPGGRLTLHQIKKKTRGPHCGDCKISLPGIKHLKTKVRPRSLVVL
jgi:hypothetical protein